MYGYEVLLMSPRRDKQIGLRFISASRHTSVISLLRAQGAYGEYRDWTLLSFRTAHASTPQSEPVEISRRAAPAGTLLSLQV